jgi:dUTP pyrophosphatase
MKTIPVRIKSIDPQIPLPYYASEGAAGMDVHAHLEKTITLNPGERTLISTGLQLELPNGFEAQIRPRSGLALKKGLTVLNSPGTIDSDYRGVIGVILINLGQEPVQIEPHERIAQMVVAPYTRVQWNMSHEMSETQRGAGGFGSTTV